jgi:hypothetical protein
VTYAVSPMVLELRDSWLTDLVTRFETYKEGDVDIDIALEEGAALGTVIVDIGTGTVVVTRTVATGPPIVGPGISVDTLETGPTPNSVGNENECEEVSVWSPASCAATTPS